MTTESTAQNATQPTLDQLAAQPPVQSELTSPIPSHQKLTEGSSTSQPAIYRDGNELLLENGASLPSNICIKTGKATKTVIFTGLRSPLNPKTWFGGEKIAVGLGIKGMEKLRINQAISLSLIILGAIMVPVGIMSGIGTAIAGLIACVAGLMVRSLFPVWTPSRTEGSIKVRGCGERYLRHFQGKE